MARQNKILFKTSPGETKLLSGNTRFSVMEAGQQYVYVSNVATWITQGTTLVTASGLAGTSRDVYVPASMPVEVSTLDPTTDGYLAALRDATDLSTTNTTVTSGIACLFKLGESDISW